MTAVRLRSAIPGGAKERLRLAIAARLEARTRASSDVLGAALVIHAVAPRAGDPAMEIDPPVSTEQLEHMVAYLSARYELVHACELVSRARRRQRGEPVPVAITFDDDLVSHVKHAAPVLGRHRAPATAFLCGRAEPFWWHSLQEAVDQDALHGSALPDIEPRLIADTLARKPWAIRELAAAIEGLDRKRLEIVTTRLAALASRVSAPLGLDGARALLDAGWELGFHTRSHDVLPRLDDQSLTAALRDGRGWLPREPRTFAYPHGKAGAREANAARAAEFEAAFTGAREVLTDATDTHLIGRLQPDVASRGRFALDFARALSLQNTRTA